MSEPAAELAEKKKKPVDWVERISNGELASLSITVQKVRHVLGDRMSSFADLTKEIVNDPGLTSKLLKIANSPLYCVTPEPIKTVSKAASFIGFDTIKSICVASRLLDAATSDSDIPESIRERALARIATSLHAAVQARSMAAKEKETLREEIFVATLLQNVGESGFWSMDSEEARILDDELVFAKDDPDACVAQTLGLTFRELSLGLVENWGLGGLVVDCLKPHPPGDREHRIVQFSNEIADCVSQHGWQSPEVTALLPQAAKLLNLTENEVKQKLINTGREAQRLARDYGAGQLAGRMERKPTPEQARRAGRKGEPDNAPDADVQLQVLRELSAMMTQKPDLNEVIRTAMDGVHRGIGMDRTVTALMSQDRQSVSTRIWMGNDGETWSKKFRFGLGGPANVLQACIMNGTPYRFSGHDSDQRARERTGPLGRFAEYNDFMIAPIEVGNRCIGIMYTDRGLSQSQLTDNDFKSFSHFAMQIGICITTITSRRR